MMFKNFQIALLILLLSSLLVFATETGEKPMEIKRSDYWTYYCKNYEEQRLCEIARKINIEQQNETFLIIYKIAKDIKSKVKENLHILTPSSSRVNINKRLKISFDNKTKFTRSFLKCENTGCLAVFKSDRMLKYSMKNFSKMKITFYGFEDEEPISLTLPMDGFTRALDDIIQELESF